MEQCKICNKSFNNNHALSAHTRLDHNLNKENYIIKTKYKGIHPLCICGCGEKLTYRPPLGDFPTYIKKHLHTIQQGKTQKDIFGDMNNPKRVQKIKSTRKENFASGKYEHIREAVKENRKQLTLGNNISQGAKGIKKPKPPGFGIGREHSDTTKEKMSQSAIDRIIKKDQHHTSNLEKTFHIILDNIGVTYIKFYYAKSIKAFYDIYIPKYNILIEVDGDFWHTNPIKYPNGPQSKVQFKNQIRDIDKNIWANENGFKLLRFWETDIKNSPKTVIKELKKHLKH